VKLLLCLSHGVHRDFLRFSGLFEEFIIVDESLLMGRYSYWYYASHQQCSQRASGIDVVMMEFDISRCRCLNAH
jgi:hypothetical protein